jgi:hypothetical protein
MREARSWALKFAQLRMLSTIVFCEDKLSGKARADIAVLLARTLACLVPAKVDGILCDVRIAGPAKAGLGLVAHHAGCGFIESENESARLRLALEAARGPRVFLLCCGHAPESGFIDEVNDLLAAAGRLQAVELLVAPESMFERLFPSRARVAGIIASRESLLSVSCEGFQALARSLGSPATLRTRARRIG